MSSFIVSDETINLVVNHMASFCERELTLPVNSNTNGLSITESPYGNYARINMSNTKDLEAVAQLILDENYRAVNTRYRENDSAHEIQFKRQITGSSSHVKVIKQCRCIMYQLAETDNYESTLAYRILKRIERVAIDKILNQHGYADEAWGL